MDESMISAQTKPSLLNQIYRRLRYHGTAQWMALILGVSCLGLLLLTTPLSLHRRNTIRVASHDQPDSERGPEAENGIVIEREGNGKAGDDQQNIADLIDEVTPEFTGPKFWDGVDWDDPLELPDKVAGTVFEMTVETGEEDLELTDLNGQMKVVTVFYRESVPKTPPKFDILLLHGSRFNSETWVTVDTTKTFAAMGYRATAIDLPGFGNSAGSVLFGHHAAVFIEAFCKAHRIKNPIIVSPSMSGGYALPYLMERPFNVTAFVALAPTSTERYSVEQYKQLQVPLLAVYGTRDSTFGAQVDRRLGVSQNHQTKLIQDARHATYLDQPDEWHRIAYIFFRRLEAWAEKLKKDGIIPTPHPPVVAPDQSETPPPEIILPALNIPRKPISPEEAEASRIQTEQINKAWDEAAAEQAAAGITQSINMNSPNLPQVLNSYVPPQQPNPEQQLAAGFLDQQEIQKNPYLATGKNAASPDSGITSPQQKPSISLTNVNQPQLQNDPVISADVDQKTFDALQKAAAMKSVDIVQNHGPVQHWNAITEQQRQVQHIPAHNVQLYNAAQSGVSTEDQQALHEAQVAQAHLSVQENPQQAQPPPRKASPPLFANGGHHAMHAQMMAQQRNLISQQQQTLTGQQQVPQAIQVAPTRTPPPGWHYSQQDLRIQQLQKQQTRRRMVFPAAAQSQAEQVAQEKQLPAQLIQQALPDQPEVIPAQQQSGQSFQQPEGVVVPKQSLDLSDQAQKLQPQQSQAVLTVQQVMDAPVSDLPGALAFAA